MLVAPPFFVHAGVLDSVFGVFVTNTTQIGSVYASTRSANAQTIPLLEAKTSAQPGLAIGGGDVIVRKGALVAQPVSEDRINTEGIQTGEISIHVVDPGDTPSEIAAMYGISLNTLLWANNIKDPSLIHPGDELVILPITGIRHVIEKGDTLRSIAKEYGSEEDLDAIVAEIVAYNDLSSATAIRVGDTVVVPGGEVPTPPAAVSPQPVKTTAPAHRQSSAPATRSSGRTSHSGWLSFPFAPSARVVETQGIHGYNAVDLAAPFGTPVHAAAAGTVIVSNGTGWNGGYGHYIVVKHPNGIQTLYAHLSANLVSVGEHVTSGEVIGHEGTTGRSTGPHLHFEVRGGTNPF